MAAFIAIDCPHCLLAIAPMEVFLTKPDLVDPVVCHAYTQCPRCRNPVCVSLKCIKITPSQVNSAAPYGGVSIIRPNFPAIGDVLLQNWNVLSVIPKLPAPIIPEHLPAEVVRPYLAAERNFPQQGMEEAAAGSYGRALDVGTKLFVPHHATQKLNNRIDKMRKEGLITQSLWEWAHLIKSIRNDALHEIESIDREELKAIRGFTETLLTYLFTLPGMLAERKAAAAAGLTEPPPGEKQAPEAAG